MRVVLTVCYAVLGLVRPTTKRSRHRTRENEKELSEMKMWLGHRIKTSSCFQSHFFHLLLPRTRCCGLIKNCGKLLIIYGINIYLNNIHFVVYIGKALWYICLLTGLLSKTQFAYFEKRHNNNEYQRLAGRLYPL
jgi:hypothetical protein